MKNLLHYSYHHIILETNVPCHSQLRSGTIRYEMVGIQPTQDADDYFVISPNSGLITIAKSLATDTTSSAAGKRPIYKVRHVPQKCIL